MSSKSSDPKTLSQALQDLERDSRESIMDQIENLKKMISEIEPKEHLKKAKDEVEKTVEKAIEKNPFMVLGIVAAVCLVLGWLLSHKNDRE